jgi:hypothetical protein
MVMLVIMFFSVGILFYLKEPIKHAGSHQEEEEQPASIKIALHKIWNMISSRRFIGIIP